MEARGLADALEDDVAMGHARAVVDGLPPEGNVDAEFHPGLGTHPLLALDVQIHEVPQQSFSAALAPPRSQQVRLIIEMDAVKAFVRRGQLVELDHGVHNREGKVVTLAERIPRIAVECVDFQAGRVRLGQQ